MVLFLSMPISMGILGQPGRRGVAVWWKSSKGPREDAAGRSMATLVDAPLTRQGEPITLQVFPNGRKPDALGLGGAFLFGNRGPVRHRRFDDGGAPAERWSGGAGDCRVTLGRVEGKLGISAWRCAFGRCVVCGELPRCYCSGSRPAGAKSLQVAGTLQRYLAAFAIRNFEVKSAPR